MSDIKILGPNGQPFRYRRCGQKHPCWWAVAVCPTMRRICSATSWLTGSLRYGRQTIRLTSNVIAVSRVRDLARNNGWASGSITRVLDNTVGANFRPILNPDYRILALMTGNKAFDATWADEYGKVVEAHLVVMV